MNTETMEYLENKIAQLSKVVREASQELQKQQRTNAMRHVQSHIRGEMRAYATVVGHLRSDLIEARGFPNTDRDKLYDAFMDLSAQADEIGNKLGAATVPTEMSRLSIAGEKIELQADQIILIYALDDVHTHQPGSGPVH